MASLSVTLLLRAHSQALAWLGRPLPVVLIGGSPGEWEGEYPLTVARALGNRQLLLAGWRPNNQHSRASYGWRLIVARVVNIYDQLAGRLDGSGLRAPEALECARIHRIVARRFPERSEVGGTGC